MNKTIYKPRAFILALIAALFIGIAMWISMMDLDSNVEQRAFNELSRSTKSQNHSITHSVEQQNASLESRATYPAVKDNSKGSLLTVTDQTDTVAKSNRLFTLCYADLDGNTYFHERKEPDVYESAMFSENLNTSSANLFVTGNIIDKYSTDVMCEHDSQSSVIVNMQASQNRDSHTENKYISYEPLDVDNQIFLGAAEKSTTMASYAANNQNYRKIAFVFESLFVALIIILIIFISVILIFKRKNKEHRQAHWDYEQFQLILSELKSPVFNYDIATKKIKVSENFVQIFGQTLPEDWACHLNVKSALYPETDFEALLRAKSEVELTGKSTHVILQAYNKDRKLLCFRIIMAPLYNENNQLNSICGMIIDVTERYDEHQNMMMEQEHLTLAVKNLASLVLSCNLTQNKYRVIYFDKDSTKINLDNGAYNEAISNGTSNLYDEDRQRFIEAFSRENLLASYKRGEKKVEIEYKKPDADGKVRWVRTTLMFVNNSLDSDVYAVALSRDITDSKKYEMFLQKTFDSTIENMPSFVGKWMFKDGDVLLIYANKEYLEFLDTTEEAAFGKSIFCGLYADINNSNSDDKSDILGALYACEKQKKPINSVFRGWKMNGEQYWLKVQASFFENEDGYSVYYGTVTDITDQIAIQQKLTKTVAELKDTYSQVAVVNAYRDLIDYSHSGGMSVRTLSKSIEQKYLYVSQGLLNSLGYTEEEYMTSVVDRHCKLLHPDDLQCVDEANWQLNDLGDAFTLEYRVRHKAGHYLWVIEHAMVAAMPSGEKVVACLTVDISEQKKLEERLRVSREEYKIAASLSSYAVLSYDVASHTYDVISNKDETHNFARTKNDVPEYAIRIGAVAPESADLVREIFAAIDKGEQRDKCIIALCSTSGSKYWMELS